jgi:hypothetical protein
MPSQARNHPQIVPKSPNPLHLIEMPLTVEQHRAEPALQHLGAAEALDVALAMPGQRGHALDISVLRRSADTLSRWSVSNSSKASRREPAADSFLARSQVSRAGLCSWHRK